nr:hypothetical protein [Dyella sp. ASV24]
MSPLLCDSFLSEQILGQGREFVGPLTGIVLSGAGSAVGVNGAKFFDSRVDPAQVDGIDCDGIVVHSIFSVIGQPVSKHGCSATEKDRSFPWLVDGDEIEDM